jgi:hypothetical protein
LLYFSNIAKAYCISASVSERIIVSSAYSNEKSFTNIFKFSEYIFLIFSKSFKLKFSSFFRCDIGVRQGENFPPFLFAIYLNDLEHFFVENNVNDLENIRNVCSENLNIFVKLFSLLYADDTIILSEI